jgi:hypothetical protein
MSLTLPSPKERVLLCCLSLDSKGIVFTVSDFTLSKQLFKVLPFGEDLGEAFFKRI